MTSQPPSSDPPPRPVGERAGLLITNLIKLGGLVLVFYDAFTPPSGIAASTWAGAAFMMAGAQGIETFITSLFGGPKR